MYSVVFVILLVVAVYIARDQYYDKFRSKDYKKKSFMEKVREDNRITRYLKRRRMRGTAVLIIAAVIGIKIWIFPEIPWVFPILLAMFIVFFVSVGNV